MLKLNQKNNYNLRITILLECMAIFLVAKVMLMFEWNQVANSSLGFIFSIMRGDSWWFKNIVEHGYMHTVLTNDPIRMNQANWAFFPFFPLMVKAVTIFGFSTESASVIVNQVELFASLYFSYQLTLTYLPKQTAMFVPLAIAVSPANIWFLAAYSDMTYLLLTILAFYSLRLRSYWWFAIIGCLLSLTRFVGFLIILPLLIHYYRNKMWSRRDLINLALQAFIILCGLLSFMFLLYEVMGDPIAFYHIQSAWGHLGTSWFSDPIGSIRGTWGSGVGHDRIFVVLLPIWLIVLIWNKYYEEAAFAFMSMLAPIAAGSLWSYSRYAMGLYPLYFAIALIARKNYIAGLAILLIATFISASYYTTWLSDGWV